MAEFRVLRSYNYIDKNPVIDVMRTALEDAGVGVADKKLKIAADISGLSVGCLHGLFHGKTRNPQHRTVAGLMCAFGYQEQWSLKKKIDLEKERVAGLKWTAEQNAKRPEAKKRVKKKAKRKGNGKA